MNNVITIPMRYLVLMLVFSCSSFAQMVNNGSITGAPCANSGINGGNAVSWSGCGFSPDLCCMTMPSYVASSAVPPVLSPDGGTWLGLAALAECAQTSISGLTIGTTYTLYFCGACFGTGTSIYNSAPANPRIIVGTSTFQPVIPMASSWTKYSMTFVANAATMTLRCEHLNGSNAYGSLDGFSLLATSPCGPSVLPVEMISFNAHYNSAAKYVDLDWSTATEKNVSHYSVERSINGVEFDEIDRVYVKSAHSYEIKNYAAIDKYPDPRRVNYYRIVSVDLDGQKEVTETKQVLVQDKDSELRIYPNPAGEKIVVDIQSVEGSEVTCEIVNMQGALVKKHTVMALDGKNSLSFDLSGLTDGIYFIKLNDGSDFYKRKFVKE